MCNSFEIITCDDVFICKNCMFIDIYVVLINFATSVVIAMLHKYCSVFTFELMDDAVM